jgi:signal transduction histidine kinase
MIGSKSAAPGSRQPLWRAWLSIGGCVALLLVFLLIPGDQLDGPGWLSVTLHTLVETASIVVSVLVFSIGWHTFSREPDSRLALACSLFLAVAVLDFVHLLTFQGMPEMGSATGAGKAIPFFLAARLLVAIALLWLSLSPWNGTSAPGARRGWFLASMAIAVAVSWSGLSSNALRDLFFVPGTGLTPWKIAAEYAIIALNLGAAGGFLLRARAADGNPYPALFAAAAIAAISELCFTLYTVATDESNDLGHVFKVYAYFLLYRAVYLHLVSLPYARLARARDEILQLNESLEARVVERTDQLAAANRELERFSWSVAHDLRSPLSAIVNLSAVLQRRGATTLDAADRGAVERIGSNALRMKEIIESLLEFAQADRVTLRREAVDLSAISARVVENLRSADPRRDVSVEIQSPMSVEGDPRLLANVMENLIGNAWKYSAERARTEITVSLEATPEGQACVVRDNGVGFDMREADRLFDAFHRIGSHESVEGHGIGLANVRKFVELHGGKVWAVSSPGQGSSFFFTLGSSAS